MSQERGGRRRVVQSMGRDMRRVRPPGSDSDPRTETSRHHTGCVGRVAGPG